MKSFFSFCGSLLFLQQFSSLLGPLSAQSTVNDCHLAYPVLAGVDENYCQMRACRQHCGAHMPEDPLKCVRAQFSTWCSVHPKTTPRPETEVPSSDSCQLIVGILESANHFCQNDACNYCKQYYPGTPLLQCVNKMFNKDCRVGLDCNAVVDNSHYNGFCRDNACPWCNLHPDPVDCLHKNYPAECSISGETSTYPPKPTPGPDRTTTPKPIEEGDVPKWGPITPGPPINKATAVFGSYFPNWFVYKKIYMGVQGIDTEGMHGNLDQRFTYWPNQMANQFSKLTHLYYAFLNLNKKCEVTDKDPAASWYGAGSEVPSWIVIPGGSCKGVMNDMMNAKNQYPHLNLMLSVGGWTYSSHFTKCVATRASRDKIFNTFKFYIGSMDSQWGTASAMWNGVDFDWEHPGAEGLEPAFDEANDWQNYVSLVQEFRQQANALGKSKLVIASAIGVGKTLDVLLKRPATGKAFCEGLDFVNLMGYDLHGKWDANTGHNAQFCQIDGRNPKSFPDPLLKWSVRDSVAKFSSMCPMKKIIMPIPTYSPAWTGIPSADNGLYQKSRKSRWATWSTFSESDSVHEAQGILSSWDLQDAVASNSVTVYEKRCPAEDGVVVPVKWVYNPSLGGGAFACYEDAETVEQKAKWAAKVGMGGVFFWDSQTDRRGTLLNAAWTGFGMSGFEKPKRGGQRCFDDRKPDFNKQPDGSEGVVGCHTKGRSVIIAAGDGCANAGNAARQQCGRDSEAIPIGAIRSGTNRCENVCTPHWGNNLVPWIGDQVYFICDGIDPLP